MYKMTMNKRFNDCPCIQKDSRMHILKNPFFTIKCHNFKNTKAMKEKFHADVELYLLKNLCQISWKSNKN